jgi:antitoxin component YwqK of YwqJK toxin-antitoxin module
MKYLIILISAFFLFLGCNENPVKKKKIGNSIIEAKFINDTLIDGNAKYYNDNGILEAEYTFVNGIRKGHDTIFYDNGKIKEERNYSDDLLNGEGRKYNVNGLLLFKLNHYYGLDVGDNTFYKNGIVIKYFFKDFAQKKIVDCTYDSTGSCNSLVFNARPVITTGIIQNQTPTIKLFVFFPHPVDFEIIYKIGFINNQQIKQDELTLNSERLFLDTVLKIPSPNLNYFLSVDYKNKSTDSIVNVYFEKF